MLNLSDSTNPSLYISLFEEGDSYSFSVRTRNKRNDESDPELEVRIEKIPRKK